jgi:hypothetical protein
MLASTPEALWRVTLDDIAFRRELKQHAEENTSTMPFSSLHDPVDMARAQAALDAAWEVVKPDIASVDADRERARLASIVAATTAHAEDEDDLMRRALKRYREKS